LASFLGSHFQKNGTLKGTVQLGSFPIVSMEKAGSSLLLASTMLPKYLNILKTAPSSIQVLSGNGLSVLAICENVNFSLFGLSFIDCGRDHSSSSRPPLSELLLRSHKNPRHHRLFLLQNLQKYSLKLAFSDFVSHPQVSAQIHHKRK
jgi:hypothetical protein